MAYFFLGLGYFISYFALLQPVPGGGVSGVGGFIETWSPAYRVQAKAAESFYAAANWLDQRLRPGYWVRITQWDGGDLRIPITNSTMPH